MKKSISFLAVFLITWSAGMTFMTDIPLLKENTQDNNGYHIKIRRRPALNSLPSKTIKPLL